MKNLLGIPPFKTTKMENLFGIPPPSVITYGRGGVDHEYGKKSEKNAILQNLPYFNHNTTTQKDATY